MNGYFKSPENITNTRVKPPYWKQLVERINENINIAILSLIDRGQWVNYEEMFTVIVSLTPSNYIMPEFIEYIENWRDKFMYENDDEQREILFKRFYNDICQRWFIKKIDTWNTGNKDEVIRNIFTNYLHQQNPTH